jgi:hypothetical protein
MLPSQIEKLFDEAPAHYEEEHHWLFRDFKTALNRGTIRAAEPDAATKSGWRANAWVKNRYFANSDGPLFVEPRPEDYDVLSPAMLKAQKWDVVASLIQGLAQRVLANLNQSEIGEPSSS